MREMCSHCVNQRYDQVCDYCNNYSNYMSKFKKGSIVKCIETGKVGVIEAISQSVPKKARISFDGIRGKWSNSVKLSGLDLVE